MRKAPKLQRRRSAYYFRYRLPADIARLLGISEIVRSLGTVLSSEALHHHILITYRVEGLIRVLRRLGAQEQAEVASLFRDWFENELEKDFKRRAEAQVRPMMYVGPRSPLERLSKMIDEQFGWPIASTELTARRTAASIAADAGRVLSNEQLNQLAILVAHGLDELKNKIARQRDSGDFSDSVGDRVVRAALQSRAGSAHAPLSDTLDVQGLAAVMDSFLEEVGPALQIKTKLDYMHTFQLARDLFGATADIRSVTIKDAREFKRLLLKYPSNATKKYPGHDFRAAVEHGSRDNAPTLSAKSINKKLSNLNSLFSWAKDNGHLHENPFARLAVPDQVSAKSKRDPFSSDQIAAIFSNGVFRPAVSPAVIHDPCSREAEEYWVTLIGYYTGMRLGEIAQLVVADVRQQHGVWIFEIHDRGNRRLKTGESKRRVPVHSDLLRLGLLDHVHRCKVSGHSAMFPNLTPASDGYESSAYSKRFSRQLVRTGVKTDRRVSFHSFRHTMKDMLRAAGVAETVQRELLGHEDGSAAAQYGRGYSLDHLRQELERIEVHPVLTTRTAAS